MTSTLNSSQLHDFGYAERKRYGQFNNNSDIFNVKDLKGLEGEKTMENSRSRRYQHHHYQPTCPYGRDDITVDNPHKVHTIYQEPSSSDLRLTEGMIPQTEPNYDYSSEMAATEGAAYTAPIPRSREGRRRMTPMDASNGIERQEDIFVSKEELQTPEQRQEALLKRQRLDQLLNGGDSQQLDNSKTSYATPYATSFDLQAPPKPLSNNVSVSSLAPFATIEYNPYENYTKARRSIASAQELQAQAQAFNQQIPHDHNLPIPTESSFPHYHDHDHVHDHVQDHAPGQVSPSLQTPYFHETSSRPMPKEGEDHELPPPQDYMESSSSSGFKGKGIDYDIPPELLQHINVSSNEPDMSPSKNSPQVESREPLSKDHITSSFDKATALTDRDYFNKIMNDPHHHLYPSSNLSSVPATAPTKEETVTREKYEQAKNRFDELYRDLMNTEDLKNHPELIEELNKISPADLERFQSPPPESSAAAVPPPTTQLNDNNNVGKEDYMNSLEDLDKKLEKMTFDDHQQTVLSSKPPVTEKTTTPSVPTDMNTTESNASLPRIKRHHFNESHIFDGIKDTPKANATATRPPFSTSQSEENMSATAKARVKASNSYNNIFGTPEYNAEVAKQEQEKRRLYSRRHWKLAQQNRSDIFCLGGDTAAVAAEEKIVEKEIGNTALPPKVPITIDRRASQMNLLASRDNPMCTTYNTMCNSFSSEDRQQMKQQPTFGLTSKQSNRTYKSKSRRFTPAGSSQILF